MKPEVKTYAATGRLPVYDKELGWYYPKQQEQHSEGGGGPQPGTPGGTVGAPLDAAVRAWMEYDVKLTYLQALMQVAKHLPKLIEGYHDELAHTGRAGRSHE